MADKEKVELTPEEINEQLKKELEALKHAKEEQEKQAEEQKENPIAKENEELRKQLEQLKSTQKEDLIKRMVDRGQMTSDFAEKWAAKQDLDTLKDFDASNPPMIKAEAPKNNVPENKIDDKDHQPKKVEEENECLTELYSETRAGWKIPDSLLKDRKSQYGWCK